MHFRCGGPHMWGASMPPTSINRNSKKELMARLISVANWKGGCGKTLISMIIAEWLAAEGSKVLVLDGDPQGTATRWASSAPENNPFPAAVMGMSHAHSKLHQLVRPLAADYEYIVIDCPPSVDAPVTQSALLASDVCITPLQPTPADLWATQGITDLINRARRVNGNLRALAVANRVSHTRLCQEALAVIRDDSDLPVLDATLGSRTSYQQAALDGSVPARMGAPHKKAAAESHAVAREILERMEWL